MKQLRPAKILSTIDGVFMFCIQNNDELGFKVVGTKRSFRNIEKQKQKNNKSGKKICRCRKNAVQQDKFRRFQ